MKRFIVTVDVERGERNAYSKDNFSIFVVKGADRYLRALRVVDVPVEFFFNVYESTYKDEEAWQKLCLRAHLRGSEVNLHTHPHYLFDSDRKNMYEYSLAEQTEIVRVGKLMLQEWGFEMPKTHRAGNYGANLDTVAALRANNISIDSSISMGDTNCRLAQQVDSSKKIFGITEFPVSAKRGSEVIPRVDVNLIDKTDFSKIETDPIVLIGHSFNAPSFDRLIELFIILKKQGEVVKFENCTD